MNTSEENTTMDVIATEEPTPAVEPVTEEPTAKELLKLKRLEQLKAARESKKAKQKAKEEEDREVREALLQLRAENASLKAAKVAEVAAPAPLPPPPQPMEVEPPQREPVVITRVDEESDTTSESEPAAPSLITEAAKIGIVGLLGLGSFYVQNHLFRAKETPPPPPPPEKAKAKKTISPPPQKRKYPLSYRPQNVLLHNNNKTKKKRVKVGHSGFSM
jgi:hypothetical protein